MLLRHVATAIPILAVCSSIFAQLAPQKEGDQGLNARIDLTVREMTVGDVVRELSKSAGVDINADPSIQSRRVIVHTQKSTVRETLDSLAELHDWTWRKSSETAFTLSQKRLLKPSMPSEVSRHMRASIPRDLRDYLQLGDVESMTPEEKSQAIGASSNERWRSIARELLDVLYIDVTNRPVSLPYSKITPASREQILLILFIESLKNAGDILYGVTGAHEINPPDAVLYMNGDVLMVQAPTPTTPNYGFGKNVVNP